MPKELKIAELERQIQYLQAELESLRKDNSPDFPSFGAPKQVISAFEQAEIAVKQHFGALKMEPENGRLMIGDHRYILVRAESMGFQMMQDMARLYADKGKDEAYRISKNILFDIAHLLGKEDARVFHKQMGITDPISKLAAGPIHFAYSGWARVELKEGSVMTPDENYQLHYSHPNSFEADAWIEHAKHSKFPVCAMNAGYSSGWCSESFELDLTSVELTCRA